MFKERKAVAGAPVLAVALGKAVALPMAGLLKSIPAAPAVQDEIKSVKVMELKLMYTENGNPFLEVKV